MKEKTAVRSKTRSQESEIRSKNKRKYADKSAGYI